MRILIIGAGDIGLQLARRLSNLQHDLTVIEADPGKVQRLREQVDAFVLEGSGTSYQILQQAHANRMDLVAAVTDNDEVNLITCMLAKKMGVPITIARVRNPEFTQQGFLLSPQEFGVDHIIHPEIETALAVVQLIHQSNATYAFEFGDGKIQVLGVRLDRSCPMLHIPLSDLYRNQDEHLRIVAVLRSHKTIIPDGNTVLLPGDQVFAVCDHHHVNDFLNLTGKKEAQTKNMMIMGGGIVGQTIAEKLQHEVNVKIIETREVKARGIANQLPNTLIIHGDGTDFELLKEEGLSDMDTFVAVTGDDENNIISSLLAHHSNVNQSIALVNKLDYLTVIPELGIDSVVSKQLLTVNAVEHLIQQEIADISTPPGMDAQLIEFIAGNRSKIVRKPLRKIRFPKGAIVGAVMRDGDVIIPHGDTQLQPGDRAVIFALPNATSKIDLLFEE